MEAITFVVGVVLRIALPAAIMFWLSARLQAWDQKRGAPC